ncbi:MAG: amidohydrolase family protein [bacterium]|jgi:aminocarboxymuconate-semialdehyde decarboxylase|nr:amidohydrolase [Betaproteobacteria bacterium]
MPIDMHAHYVPPRIIDVLRERGAALGIEVIDRAGSCPCLAFAHVKPRPFFPRLLEAESARIASMDGNGISRQVLSMWADVFGYGLPARQAIGWHQLMNESLAATCGRRPDRFSWFASGPLPDAAAAARELERCVKELGASGGMVAANVEGVNLGNLPLDEYWAAAQQLGVPVFIHPAQPESLPRTALFGLNPIVQYTFDTTLTLGSLMFSGVLDRFPALDLVVSHGGGALPYLVGRFDVMNVRMERAHQHNVAMQSPSDYLRRFHYDTILHDPDALRYLAAKVGTDRLVLGSDDPFPPMDADPLASLAAAGFDATQVAQIAEANPRRLLRLAA